MRPLAWGRLELCHLGTVPRGGACGVRFLPALAVWGRRILEQVLSKLKPINWIVTQAFVWFGWLLFFYPVDQAVTMARLLFVT